MRKSTDIPGYVQLSFDASEKTVKYILNNYNFPQTVNTDYEEEAENVFRAYLQHAGALLHGSVNIDHRAFIREHKRIYNAVLTDELKAMIVEELRLHDLNNLL